MTARTTTAALTLPFVLLSIGCEPTVPDVVPSRDLTGVEAPIAEAVQQARRAVGRQLESAEAWGALGDRYYVHDWFDEAARCYVRAEALDADNPVWVYRRGQALHALKREAAVEAFERFLALRADYPPAYVILGDALARAGRNDEARSRYETALRLDPRNSHAALGLGQLALQAGDFAGARDHLEAAIGLRDDHGEAHIALSQAYMGLGDAERSAEHAARSRQLPKNTPRSDPLAGPSLPPVGSQALNTFGSRAAAEGREADAERAFREAIAIKPQYSEAHYNLGTLLARQRRTVEALPHLEQAVAARPNYADGQANLGRALLDLGRLEEAEPCFRKAIEINPELAVAHNGLAGILRVDGRTAEAAAHYEQALRLRPDYPEASCWLAWILATSGDDALRDPSRAVTLAEHAAGVTGFSAPVPLDVLAAAYAAAGRFDDARLFQQRAIDGARSRGMSDLLPAFEARLGAYRAGRAHREP